MSGTSAPLLPPASHYRSHPPTITILLHYHQSRDKQGPHSVVELQSNLFDCLQTIHCYAMNIQVKTTIIA
jgi:hypothetical protein